MGSRNKTKRIFYFIILLILLANQIQSNKEAKIDNEQTLHSDNLFVKKRVGILSLPIRKKFGETISDILDNNNLNQIQNLLRTESSYYPTSYPRWTEHSFEDLIEIIPLEFYSINENNIDNILDHIDAVLLTGGASPLFHNNISTRNSQDFGEIQKVLTKHFSTYTKKVSMIIEKVQAINDLQERQFPIWGTCLGFESMLVHYLGKEFMFDKIPNFHNLSPIQILENNGIENYMFSKFKDNELQQIQQGDYHFFNHGNATVYDKIIQNQKFNQNFYPTALSKVKNNDVVILAAFQHKKYPFYAVQYHPEKFFYEIDNGPESDDEHRNISARYQQFFIDNVLSREYQQPNFNFLEQNKKKKIELEKVGPFKKIEVFMPVEFEM